MCCASMDSPASAAFTAKAEVWPTAQASGDNHPQTTRNIPKDVQTQV